MLLGIVLSVLVSLPARADLVEPDTEYLVFHHRDVLGTAIATTDSNGNVVHHTSTTPYGRDLGRRADDGQGFSDNAYPSSRSGEGYTGHVNDRQLELTYMRARFYDPVLGRFLSNDPVGFTSENPTSFNRYAYANNSPYRFVDPDGRQAVEGNESLTQAEQLEQLGLTSPSSRVVDAAATYNSLMSNEVAGGIEEGYKAAAGGAALGLFTRGARWARSFFGRGGATAVDANKLNHVFGNADHGLDGLVGAFGGSQTKAYNAVQDAANAALKRGDLKPRSNGVLPGGQFGAVLNVGGVNVQLVGGRVLDGKVQIGSFSRRFLND